MSKKSSTHSRPCDACAVRRVRCDIQTSTTGRCTSCSNHNIQCTNIRVRQKSGPKRIKDKTRKNIVNLISSAASPSPEQTSINLNNNITNNINKNNNTAKLISLSELLPYLQVYQTWFYGLWPVLSVAHMVSKLQKHNTENIGFIVDEISAPDYALCCALCAAVGRHREFLKSTQTVLQLDNCLEPKEYAREANRIIYEYQLAETPSMELLLADFFLHLYYGNIRNGRTRGMMYLREAISLAHILGMHDPVTLMNRSTAESHRYKKIYYMLLITERFTGFEQNLPVLLEPTIPIPDLKDEEYPELLNGFTELAQVFSATDKRFYLELHRKVLNSDRNSDALMGYSDISIFQDFLQNKSNNSKKQWLYQLQSKLSRHIESNRIASDTQKVNIILSRSWFQSLGWLISSENFLIDPNVNDSNLSLTNPNQEVDCFDIKFPLKISRDFLESTKSFSNFAFESNGPGAALKLLQIADSLYSYTVLSMEQPDSVTALDQLNTIFNMVVKFRSDLELPKQAYSKIGALLESRKFNHRQLSYNTASMELIDEDETELYSLEHLRRNTNSNPRAEEDNDQPEQDSGSSIPKIEEVFSHKATLDQHRSSSSTADSILSDHTTRPASISSVDSVSNEFNVDIELSQDLNLFESNVAGSNGSLQKSPSNLILSGMTNSLNCLSPFFMNQYTTGNDSVANC